ncbi:MAG TPA: DUF4394 domain-containing protein [Thermoanaerobaculia bacterium]|nr:DUF4394 domain-containing protein [Thermoanaerobaculia bacterium]
MRAREPQSIVSAALLALLFCAAPQIAQGAQGSDDAAERARAAEAEARPGPDYGSVQLPETPLGITHPLLIGVDDAAIPASLIDPTVPDYIDLPLGIAIWGAAFDPVERRFYLSSGSTLHHYDLDTATLTTIGTITSSVNGATLVMEGLAFTGGILWGSRVGTAALNPEGIYTLDPATAVATLNSAFNVTTDQTLSGLDADPRTGTLYGTNDATAFRGLVEIPLDGTVSVVAPYPAGETDIDGLAIGTDGRAYLVEDDGTGSAGAVHVWDFDAASYGTPIPTPWATNEIFSAGAWNFDPLERAFGIDLLGTDLLAIDPDLPAVRVEVAPGLADTFYGGDFHGNDFGTLFAVDNATTTLYAIDVATGAPVPIGPMVPSAGETWTGMAGGGDGGAMYASATSCAASTLYTVDLATGAATAVGPITNGPCVIDIAVDANGQMFGIDILGDLLLSIDPATGAGTVVGPIGFDANFAQGMDFDAATGVLYLAAYNNGAGRAELRTVDLVTGASTFVGRLSAGTGVEVDAFALAIPSLPFLDGFESGDTSRWSFAMP